MKFETRTQSSERAKVSDDGVHVEGYAAVFDQEANIAGLFLERIAPGAFSEAISRDDVVFLVNHEGLPLARTRSGTLTLSEDDHGLKIESKLDPDDPDVAQIVPKMRRGDLDKMSFAFIATRQEWDETGDIPVRIVHEAELYDVSVVTTPAFQGTEIALRSRAASLPKTDFATMLRKKNVRIADFVRKAR